MDKLLYFVLLILWWTSWCSGQIKPTRFRLTAERGGPPQGAQFVPIPTITGFPTGPRPFKRPHAITGIPPPPPEPTANTEEPLTFPITNPPTTEEVVTETIPPLPTTPPTPPPPPPINLVVSVTQPPSTFKPQSTTTVAPSTVTTTAKDDGFVFNLFSQDDDGSYYFEYLTKHSAHRREQGFFKQETGHPGKVHVKTGLYSFISPEGKSVRIDYIADEKGYRAYETRASRMARKFANTRRQS